MCIAIGLVCGFATGGRAVWDMRRDVKRHRRHIIEHEDVHHWHAQWLQAESSEWLPVSEMTCTVSSGTLNSTLLYCTLSGCSRHHQRGAVAYCGGHTTYYQYADTAWRRATVRYLGLAKEEVYWWGEFLRVE